ncbi:hypothetical protein B0H67DRAFT_479525 [Lasiosphaeris hirsuta]|uniref:Uncharacterized protein n=1 Tax=Lasiosphaeris hirsuta TaxID=260670 RepID=A0AA40B0T9_9PEZI|nr:hypothetical protein B0H67DRAFT_479525 [Lasiosphaeris hirsuta]
MRINRVVTYKFKPMATPEEVCNRMLALKDGCVHPLTHRPYMRTPVGGAETSPEQLQVRGLPHGYMATWPRTDDWDIQEVLSRRGE